MTESGTEPYHFNRGTLELLDQHILAKDVLAYHPIVHVADLIDEREKFSSHCSTTGVREKIQLYYFLYRNYKKKSGMKNNNLHEQ